MPKARLDDTLEMHYEDDDFTDPWRTPEVVVMHHGNCKSSRFWYKWVPLLARQYRVIRLDMRGFGRSSEPPPGYQWSISNLAEDLKRLLDFLNLDKVHLIGETLGGAVSYRFAYQYPERLKSLTTCNSPFKFGAQFAQFLDRVKENGLETMYRNGMSRRFDSDQSDPAHLEWFVQEISKTNIRVFEGVQGNLAGNDLTEMLSQTRVPTLILSPERIDENRQFPFEEVHRLMPNSKLIVFPGTMGFIQYSAPEMCAAAWQEFVGSLG